MTSLRTFSGIQPTGSKHLGNYLGAIRQYEAAQSLGESLFCVVDLHAMTVPFEPTVLKERVLDTTALLIACGLDPDKCILFRQSAISEHSELSTILSNVASFGDLSRMHQFKDKSSKQRELVSVGLFTYPVLQAADILLYRATDVPVGDDQRQHIELARNIAASFNKRFGDTLPLPSHRIPKVAARVMDLQDPTSKMSTSSASPKGTVYVLDEPEAISKKFRSAQTDSEDNISVSDDQPGIKNLVTILAAIRGQEVQQTLDSLEGARYGDLKNICGIEVGAHLAPLAERYKEIRSDLDYLVDMLNFGAEKAMPIAEDTMHAVRQAVGIGDLF